MGWSGRCRTPSQFLSYAMSTAGARARVGRPGPDQPVAGAVDRESRRVRRDRERVRQPDAMQACRRRRWDRSPASPCPGGAEVSVSPGRIPSRHVLPPSFEVEKAMLAAPPVRLRPFWKSATVVWSRRCRSPARPAYSCWLSAFDCRSRWRRVLTTSQSLSTRSRASAATTSRPGPHEIRSMPPSYSAEIRSSPARATMRSEPSRPARKSARVVPRIGGCAAASATVGGTARRRTIATRTRTAET